MAMGVAGVTASEEGDSAAAALVGEAGGVTPLVAAGKEPPPQSDGASAVEVEEKGAEPPLEGAPMGISMEREEEVHKAEEKNEADAEGGVPAVEVEGKGAVPQPPLEGAPTVITVEGEEAHKAEGKKADGAEVEPEPEAKAEAEAEEEDEGEKWLGHYSSGQSILIVGDGDFSFSLALATAFDSGANLVATSLDSYGLSTSIASASSCGG
jgi:25S rRNA (uracil2634-N3)-methyltransferase